MSCFHKQPACRRMLLMNRCSVWSKAPASRLRIWIVINGVFLLPNDMILGIDASRANVMQKTGVEWYAWRIIQEFKNIIPADVRVILYSREPHSSRNNIFEFLNN